MYKKIAVCLFNLSPAFIQQKIFFLDKRFLSHFNFIKLLDNFKSFSFIQVGANDGVSFDVLYKYLKNKQNINLGILIEPIKEYFIELENNYAEFKNVKCVNYALHPALSEFELYRVDPAKTSSLPEWSKGIPSINKDHHVKLGIPDECMLKEKVASITLKQLLERFGQGKLHFNFLQIDTEGFDAEIIKMIDFKTMDFDIIKFERVNLQGNDYDEVITLLKENKYFIIEVPEDTLAIKKHIKLAIT